MFGVGANSMHEKTSDSDPMRCDAARPRAAARLPRSTPPTSCSSAPRASTSPPSASAATGRQCVGGAEGPIQLCSRRAQGDTGRSGPTLRPAARGVSGTSCAGATDPCLTNMSPALAPCPNTMSNFEASVCVQAGRFAHGPCHPPAHSRRQCPLTFGHPRHGVPALDAPKHPQSPPVVSAAPCLECPPTPGALMWRRRPRACCL